MRSLLYDICNAMTRNEWKRLADRMVLVGTKQKREKTSTDSPKERDGW